MRMHKAVLSSIALLGAGVVVVTGTDTTATTPTAATTRADSARGVNAPPQQGGWYQVGRDMKSGISGLAVTSRTGGTYSALIVRDNKKPGENRMARLAFRPGRSTAPTVRTLTWKGGAEPLDLEALEAVPGAPDEFLAVASRGLVYRIKVTDGGTAVEVLDLAPLPAIGEGDDFESFALVSQHGKLAAVWADRGKRADRPATLYAAPLSFNKYGETKFGAVAKAAYRAPYPAGNVRHASDISVNTAGRMLIAAAADEGDDGPFDSAVVDAGRLSVDRAGKVRLSVAKSPEVLRKFRGHKVEAVDCVPGARTAVFGTDDENAGGATTTVARLCD
ncbi:hypothetical protein [Streptomyces sp. NPDC054863]